MSRNAATRSSPIVAIVGGDGDGFAMGTSAVAHPPAAYAAPANVWSTSDREITTYAPPSEVEVSAGGCCVVLPLHAVANCPHPEAPSAATARVSSARRATATVPVFVFAIAGAPAHDAESVVGADQPVAGA